MKKKANVRTYDLVHEAIRQQDIVMTHRQQGFTVFNQEVVSPHLVITYCHEGSARGIYDRREWKYGKGDLFIVMPEHLVNQLWCSDDFVFTRIVVSAQLVKETLAYGLTHVKDPQRLGTMLRLNTAQTRPLLTIANLLADISAEKAGDPALLRQALTDLLLSGYRLLCLYGADQEEKGDVRSRSNLFADFCRLVVEHWRESREVQFYAGQLGLTPKYFAKVFRSVSGGLSPTEWIEQYVIMQAKRIIASHPDWSFSAIAADIGFNEPQSFHRYFKRITGIIASEYRYSLTSENQVNMYK